MYRRILVREPANGDAIHFLGMLAHQTGRNQEGIDLLEKSMKMFPNNAVYFNNAGTIFTGLKEYARAANAYQRALSLNPNLPEAHFNLGKVFLEVRALDNARLAIETALSLRPNYAEALSELGRIFNLQEMPAEALARFQAAAAANPKFAEAYCNMGITLMKLGRLQEALDCLRQAEALNPELNDAHLNISQLLFMKGDYENSLRHYLRSKNPDGGICAGIFKLVDAKSWCTANGKYYYLGEATQWEIADPAHIGANFRAKGGIAHSNELFVAELADAKSFGGSDLILCNADYAIHELVSHSLGELTDISYDLPIKFRKDGHFLVDYVAKDVIEGEAGILLTGVSTYAFGHWLGDYFPKFKLLNEFPAYRNFPIYVDLEMPATHFEMLEMLTNGTREIIPVPRKSCISLGRLVFASHFTHFPALCAPEAEPSTRIAPVSTVACRYVSETFLQICGLDSTPRPPGHRGRRLFIGRGPGLRNVTNEDELQAIFVKHGFEVIYPATLSFREQIAIFNEAECVAGPHGSAFVNVLFCKQGTKVINFVQTYASNFSSWAHTVEELGHKHLYVCGIPIPKTAGHEHHLNYFVPPPLAEEAIHYFDLA